MSLTNQDLVEVRENSSAGRGVFARTAIVVGAIVGVFDGEAGSATLEELSTFGDPWWEQSVHLRRDGDTLFYLMPTAEPDGIDFLNHSCKPNCAVVDKLFVVAARDIGQGEEITADYRTFDEVPRGIPCRCPNPQCVI